MNNPSPADVTLTGLVNSISPKCIICKAKQDQRHWNAKCDL